MVVDLPTVTVTHSDLRPDNYAVDEHGKLHLFDFESAELAPHTAAWSALLIDLWLNEHPQAGDVIDTELWSPECLTFKAALTTTHKAWKTGQKPPMPTYILSTYWPNAAEYRQLAPWQTRNQDLQQHSHQLQNPVNKTLDFLPTLTDGDSCFTDDCLLTKSKTS